MLCKFHSTGQVKLEPNHDNKQSNNLLEGKSVKNNVLLT